MAGNTADRVRELVAPAVQSLGLRLWDVRYLKEGADWYLRVFIDSDKGVDIDDCTNTSRLIDPMLDEADIIRSSYYLEVCSPGLERELVRPEHFTEMLGRSVQVHLVRPFEGQKDFVGDLKSYDNGDITLATEDMELKFQKPMISKVKLNDYMEENIKNG